MFFHGVHYLLELIIFTLLDGSKHVLFVLGLAIVGCFFRHDLQLQIVLL